MPEVTPMQDYKEANGHLAKAEAAIKVALSSGNHLWSELAIAHATLATLPGEH